MTLQRRHSLLNIGIGFVTGASIMCLVWGALYWREAALRHAETAKPTEAGSLLLSDYTNGTLATGTSGLISLSSTVAPMQAQLRGEVTGVRVNDKGLVTAATPLTGSITSVPTLTVTSGEEVNPWIPRTFTDKVTGCGYLVWMSEGRVAFVLPRMAAWTPGKQVQVCQ